MIATACFLIDKLCLRVGDEKKPTRPTARPPPGAYPDRRGRVVISS